MREGLVKSDRPGQGCTAKIKETVMTINWSDINVDEIIDTAGQKTDDELAGRISSLTRLTDEEIKELFPQSADAKKVVQLMKVVKSSASRNTKVARIAENIEDLGGVVLTLLNKVV
jgi:hypothetical protein